MNGGYLKGCGVNNITVVHMFKCELPIAMSIFLRITRQSTLQPQVVHWLYIISLSWECFHSTFETL
jgi:hypothetical protein